MYIGIDLGQRRIHLMGLDDQLRLAQATVRDVAELESLTDALGRADVVAIDAPEALSTPPHAGEETLPPKFRSARSAEIALGREHAIWVPWVTPTIDLPPWMQVEMSAVRSVPGGAATSAEINPDPAAPVRSGTVRGMRGVRSVRLRRLRPRRNEPGFVRPAVTLPREPTAIGFPLQS